MPILANNHLLNLKKLKTYGLMALSLVITLNLQAQDSIADCIEKISESTEAQANQKTMLKDIQSCQSCCTAAAASPTAQNFDPMELFSCLEVYCSQIQDLDPRIPPVRTDIAYRDNCCLNILYQDGNTNSPSPTALLTNIEKQAGFKTPVEQAQYLSLYAPNLVQTCIGT